MCPDTGHTRDPKKEHDYKLVFGHIIGSEGGNTPDIESVQTYNKKCNEQILI
jgi:hypothetical protein